MPYTPIDRKVALMKAEVTQVQVAKELGLPDAGLVSQVVSGRKVNSPAGRRIAEKIAEHIGDPVDVVFPELQIEAV